MKLLIASVFCAVLYTALGDCPQGLCPQTETCCNGPSPGLYGCCPEPNAVCCTDGLHCCPQNTVCNLAQGTCDDKVNDVFQFKKDISTRMMVARKANDIACPGGEYYCPDGSTCCVLPTGEYGCCPYASAVCCPDKEHCCPSGSTCDSTSTYCIQGGNRFFSLFKRPAFPMK